MKLPLRVELDRLIAGMNAFAELLRHLVMPDRSRRGRKWCLRARKTEKEDKTNEESEMFHRASMSKRGLSVNSRKLSESSGTNERPKPRLTLLSAVLTTGAQQPAMKLGQILTSRVHRAKNRIHMNSKLASKLKHLVAALTVIGFVGVVSLGCLAAQSAVTLPMKVDSDISGIGLELTSVQRTGDTIMVRFKYISTRDKPTRIDTESGQRVSEMYYVDAKNKKKYPIIKDTENKPLSSNLEYFEVGAGETKAGWAKFPAPAPDVTAIS